MTGIAELFAELSEPDFYDVSAQLELFVWRRRKKLREYHQNWYRRIRATPSGREEFNARYRDYYREYRRKERARSNPKRKPRMSSSDPGWAEHRRAVVRAAQARYRAARRAA